MDKVKIAVLYGGPSAEHEVSVASAKNVLTQLDTNKYDVIGISITKAGLWVDDSSHQEFTEAEGLKYLQSSQVAMVFILIHGEYGEDGTIQKLLEDNNIPFIGTGSEASALAMDKVESSRVLTEAGLKVPRFVVGAWSDSGFSYPLVVKPTDRGSSVGITIVKDQSEFDGAIKTAHEFSDNIMIQEFIDGRELTCGVIEGHDGKLIPLTPTEILPNKDHTFFDYDAKYVAGASVEKTPPDLPEEMIIKIQNEAVVAHKALGCRHVSRADFILSGDTLYTLEVNTLPGMTGTSLLPQGAKAAGIEFPELLDNIITAALNK